ncbi:MAG: glycine cleavage system aminomethyltransferase GcvT [Candidatus Heimdallarchaeota archaeon]|nr:glycine cleavage system aminomethyltransferase GcvT [Candidatus Heimdallarchaeota archaeon]MCK4290981.1 glycine cleavage system aminomethyltransferase GcvT [Candidatus Heimdallarchaeota archaeon]
MTDMRTPIYEWHKENGDMASFGGWELPMQFTSIRKEHMAVRENAGIFDVSHMGRFRFTGKDAFPMLNKILPRNLMKLADGRCGYSYLLDENGGMIDDCVTMRKSEDYAIFVCNAGPRINDWNWMIKFIDGEKQKNPNLDISYYDFTLDSAMFALQGPKGVKILEIMTDIEIPRSWGYFETQLDGIDVMASRTGYTGEDGFEITIVGTKDTIAEKATKLWKAILKVGEPFGLLPCGLGARDTLRLGGGLPLSGQDFTPEYDPFEMDLGFQGIFIDMNKEFFIGQEALKAKYPTLNEEKKLTLKEMTRKRVGIELLKKGIPRHGYKIHSEGKEIGEVASGSISPLTGKGIAMAILPLAYTALDTEFTIIIRDKPYPAKVVKYPFFDTTKYGRRREQ